jgi:hypothetical protein
VKGECRVADFPHTVQITDFGRTHLRHTT